MGENSNQNVDHGARLLIEDIRGKTAVLETGLKATDKRFEDHLRHNEVFEIEMRGQLQTISTEIKTGLAAVSEQISSSTGKVHSRLDNLIRMALIGAITLVVGLIGYIWVSQVGV